MLGSARSNAVAVGLVMVAAGHGIAVAVLASGGSPATIAIAVGVSFAAAAVALVLSIVRYAGAIERELLRTLEPTRTRLTRPRRAASGSHPAIDSIQAQPELDRLRGSMRSLSHQLEQTMSLLGKERDRFAAVVQAMDYAVLALDPEQRVTTVNEAARSLLGIEAAGEGRKLLEVVRIPALTELVTNASKEVGQRIEFDSHGVVNRRLRAHANRLPDGGVVVVLHDLTELRRLERVRRDFVAAVSHELRTPISVIKANAETLLEGGLEHPVAGRGFAEAIARHSDRLAAMVEDLLDISRVEAGRYPLTMRRIDLQPVVAQVCELMTSRAAEAQAELVDAIDGPVWVEGDDKAAEHVLLNLVDNALKYGGSGNRVEISRSIRGEAVRVEVRDAGPGVDPKHQPRLFERFYRVDSGRSRDRGGTGLGLAIVRNLVEAMGGTVGVRSGGSRGSVFWFELRRAEAGGADSPESAG